MHRLFALYLLVSAPALLFAHRPWYGLPLFGLHLLLAGLAWRATSPNGRGAERKPGADAPQIGSTDGARTRRILADWYPLLLIPLLYKELAVLNSAIWNDRYFDGVIQAAEQQLFGGQPSSELALRYPNPILSELLHAAYLSYYLIIYVPPLILYARSRFAEHRIVVFTIMLTFFLHYLFFIYFPVQGPRYLSPEGSASSGPVHALTHEILQAGSARGAAFPSSHLGVAVAQTIESFRMLPGLAPVFAVLSTGLGVGAVYGGFHYATDMVAGLVLGVTAVALAPAARRQLAPGRSSMDDPVERSTLAQRHG